MKKSVKLFALLIICLLLTGCKEDSVPTESKILPLTPTLSSPANNATDVTIPVTLSWNTSSGAASYGLQVSTDSQFINIVYDTNGLTTTNQQISGVSNSIKYYWHVNATNAHGTSEWSGSWRFTTRAIWTCGNSILYTGRTYNTVQIGNQCWLKENLDVGTMIQESDTAKDNGEIEKYCYNNDTINCDTYGGLYQWNEAMKYTIVEGAQGICPPGWHIPTLTEFQTLSTTVGGDGNALKAIGQGDGEGAGTNTSDFSALLSGIRHDEGYFTYLNFNTLFWSSKGVDTYIASTMYLDYSHVAIGFGYDYKDFGFSIRCLRD